MLADGFIEDVYVNPGTWMIDAEKRVVPMHAFGKRYTTIDIMSGLPAGGRRHARARLFKEIDEDTEVRFSRRAR